MPRKEYFEIAVIVLSADDFMRAELPSDLHLHASLRCHQAN
jgi:hypothetical protein